jgi:RimJ/RimL family protein N-acetyltransferase
VTVALRFADRTAFREIELDARQTWEAAVAAVPRDSLERPAPPNGRSVKDLVAHIASWERWGAERLEATLAGVTLAPIGEWEPFEHNFNQVAYEHWRGEPWATVAAEAASSYASFWEKVEALNDEQLFGPRGQARMVRACGSEHYEPYVAQIRTLIEELPLLLSIETARLRLRSFRPSDAPSLLAVFLDPEVRRFLPPGPPPTLARIQRSIDRRISGERADGFSLYAVERREGGEPIGSCGLALVDGTGPEIELAYHYGRRWWGQGFATEAAIACLRHAFDDLALERVIAICYPDNAASLRVIEKAGMSAEGMGEYYGAQMKKYAAERPTWRAPRSP